MTIRGAQGPQSSKFTIRSSYGTVALTIINHSCAMVDGGDSALRDLPPPRPAPERSMPSKKLLAIVGRHAPLVRVSAKPRNDPRTVFQMRTIVMATQKGGAGKSTLSIGLALAAQEAGHIVRLIETDKQGTLSNWQCRRGLAEPIVEAVYDARAIERRLEALERGGVTLTIIDTAAGINATNTAAIRSAVPPPRSTRKRRAISPTCSPNPSSSCATTTRMRWRRAVASPNMPRQASRPK